MKAYWMNSEIKINEATERPVAKKRFNEIEATETQRNAIFALQRHVFGSKEAYFAFRESGAEFPKWYRDFKNFILLLNGDFCNEEFFAELIKLCPKAQLISEEIKTADNECAGDGTKSESITIDARLAKYIRMDERKGTRARSTARNPLLRQTYVARVSVVQSRARATNYNETEVRRIAEIYTEMYNAKFGTNFEVYHSNKKTAKVAESE